MKCAIPRCSRIPLRAGRFPLAGRPFSAADKASRVMGNSCWAGCHPASFVSLGPDAGLVDQEQKTAP